MPSSAFLLEFLKGDQGKRKGWLGWEGKQDSALLLKGTLWERPFRKGKGQETGGPCLLVPSYLTFLGKKEDNRERKGVERKGKKARLCPFIARNVVGELV